MASFNSIIHQEDDGLYTPPIGTWGLEKYRMIGAYMNIFTSSMSNNKTWKNLVYVDLFAGAGFARLKKTNQIVRSSALISLSIPKKFDKYIFCEENAKAFKALDYRISKFKGLDIASFNIDSNKDIEQVIEELDKVEKPALCFCFIDPFSINIHFDTIRKLASKYRMDFLILFASDMDIRRNHNLYSDENDTRVSQQLGNNNWREDYKKKYTHTPQNLIKYVSESYIGKMKSIGYEFSHHEAISNKERNRILYHLIFFSKHKLGKKFATISSSYSDNQIGFNL